ncbi:hypothetical protein IMG5_102580 [Ichthyophthirius multifiliis]|uniref:Uncharacterized protein n=1 Tax=Ichthyophthirius multifiliis TaxID=5932 RepID=G0QSP2_ICHMU|nr:hypothetical protein IMG5_102580 [Ichthyophthirius multifiliis]EGR31758.1 hypothetical protein IMG5_102580 [Ichthyophthirius multifiliis]|eukprot:XP_004035244.1 hypothetical protein IMG5_102580 [Ichthyophthirius multifiliis]
MIINKLILISLFLTFALTFTPPQPLQGNILRCVGEIGNAVEDITKLITSCMSKQVSSIITDIGKVAGRLQPLMKECSNANCLTDALKRCEEAEQKKCEPYGAIAYPKCPEGQYNVGCCLCAQLCPQGFTDQGLFCAKAAPYGRGAGYAWKFGDSFNLNNALQRCEKDNSQYGCEKSGLLIYPKCKPGFHPVGCCICSPDCPEGYTDIGVSCQKPIATYGRGAGYPMFYEDCADEDTTKKLRKQNDSNLNCDQLNQSMIQLSQDFLQNQLHASKIVEISIKLSQSMSGFESKCNV